MGCAPCLLPPYCPTLDAEAANPPAPFMAMSYSLIHLLASPAPTLSPATPSLRPVPQAPPLRPARAAICSSSKTLPWAAGWSGRSSSGTSLCSELGRSGEPGRWPAAPGLTGWLQLVCWGLPLGATVGNAQCPHLSCVAVMTAAAPAAPFHVPAAVPTGLPSAAGSTLGAATTATLFPITSRPHSNSACGRSRGSADSAVPGPSPLAQPG